MGTRGLNGFISQGETKASYNHFDSYPENLGKDMLLFILRVNKEKGWDKLTKKIANLKMIDEESKPTEKDIQRYTELGYYDPRVGGKSVEPTWYQLLRQTQGVKWMDEVYDNFQEHAIDNQDFIKDSLFCEHAYLINLDKMELEYWKGFQHKPQKGNRYGTKAPAPSYKGADSYYPCALMGTFQLGDITSQKKVAVYLKKMVELSKEEEEK